MPICAFCQRDCELCASHSIPDGFFKAISRRNNGQLISIPKGKGKIGLSQNTGKAKLLCRECEANFNKNFDSPLTNALKAWDKQIKADGLGVRYEFSPNHLAQCLASVCWRASVTGNSMYANARVSVRDRARLLALLLGGRENTLKSCSCSIKRLYDKRPPTDGGFSQEVVSGIILPVNAYRISKKGKKPGNHFAFALLVQGFLCHLMIPRLPHALRVGPAFLKPSKTSMHAPPQYFADYKPLMDAMVAGLGKHLEGQSTLKE
ncbi:hypothetical protein [Roseivivax sp. CAU 1753]